MAAHLTPSEPLTHKRQRHEAKITAPELEQPQPEQRADAVYQQSEETIQLLREEIQRLREEIQRLREEIQRLRLENRNQHARRLALIKGFVTFAAVVELAVDVRGAELRCGLSSMGGTPEQMQEQARQMMHFCSTTSWHVTMLVNDMMEEQGDCLTDTLKRRYFGMYENAQPDQAMRVILDERLPFTMGRSGPCAMHLLMISLNIRLRGRITGE